MNKKIEIALAALVLMLGLTATYYLAERAPVEDTANFKIY